MLRRLTFRLGIAVAVLATPHVGHAGRAGGCPPAVALTGDPAAVRAVRAQLDARGIADETPRCPAVHARVERRGAMLVVGLVAGAPGLAGIDRPGHAPGAPPAPGATPGASPAPGAPPWPPGETIERTVSEPATAATVIESWTRSDVAAPLLASRAVPADAGEPPVAVAAPPAAQGIQLFAAEETSMASDRTVWEGMQLGACVMLGPICAAARVHAGTVVSRPASWSAFSRKGGEVYAGIDVPIAVRWTRLTLGFAAGYGSMFTRHHGEADPGETMGVEISGPRAEVHAALSLPLTPHIALDLMATGALTQATGTETHGPGTLDPTVIFPDEPRALVRLAIGVRYGAL